MVMEYVEGMTLKEYIQRNGPIEVQEALDIMKQVTIAIAHAHANDIVHRDIKPQNILIDTYGQVKVTDFGIAIALSATALTQTNAVLGSDRKSTRLNSSHVAISYAVFCLKKK